MLAINWFRVGLLSLWIYLGYILLRIIIDLIMHYRFKALCERTAEYVFKEMGHIIAVIGGIRKGKSSLVSGITHCLEYKLISKARTTIQEIKEILFTLDYNYLDSLIIQTFLVIHEIDDEKKHLSTNEIIEEIISKIPEDYKMQIYNNRIEEKTYKELLRKYIIAFVRMADGNFLASKLTFRSRNTGYYARQYNPFYSQIKDCYELKLWPLDHYLVIVNNETSLDGRDSHFATKLAHEDSGVPNFYKTVGHMFEETTFYIGDIQNIIELNSKDRKLSTTIVETKGINIVGGFPTLIKILGFIKAINQKLEHLFFWFKYLKKKKHIRKEMIHEAINQPNRFKKVNYFFITLKNHLFAKYILLFDSRFYSRTDDIGKTNTDANKYYESFNCIFPLTYCWGTFDTHELKYIKETLMNQSKISLRDLEDFSSANAVRNYQERLTKYVLEKEVKEKIRSDLQKGQSGFNYDDYDE